MTIAAALYSSARQDWGTPPELFRQLHQRFNFTVDAAAHEGNHLLPRYWGRGGELPCGIAADWTGERIYCNPPYGRGVINPWVAKAAELEAKVAVLLLPARTDTAWFHDHVRGIASVHFLRGRVRFYGAKSAAPFPSMIAIYGKGSDRSDTYRSIDLSRSLSRSTGAAS